MIVYLDTSVALRRLLRHPLAIPNWGMWDQAYSSVLLRVEGRRMLDRWRLEGVVDDARRVTVAREFQDICGGVCLCGLAPEILERASEPFPTFIKTLDALHLATALTVAASEKATIQMWTHDVQLARAAQALGMETLGT